jgi:ABC-type phosphonate transport system ATPase subunit
MTTKRVKDVRFFETREEMTQAFLNGEKRPGEVFALAEIERDVLADFLATPWVYQSPDDGLGMEVDSSGS